MITEQDLQEAIAECKGIRNPNASTAIKLAAFLTIQREMFGTPSITEKPTMSFSGPNTVGAYGDSDFLRAVNKKDQTEVWSVMDELMDSLKVINERLYQSVMRKLR